MRIARLFLLTLTFVVFSAAAADAGVKVAKKNISLKAKLYSISIDYPVTGVKAIDDVLAKYAKDQAADDKGADGGDPSTHNGDRPYEFETTYTVARNDNQVFAVRFEEYADTGGAHPNTGYAAFNFLMPDGALVFLPEIVDGQRGINAISKIVSADLLKRLGGPDGMSDDDWIKRGAGPLATNFAVFTLQPKKIEFIFPPYQVAAYAAGPQDASVSLAALKGVMRADPRAPQASFNCTKAKTIIERAICADAALARLDRQVAELYAQKLAETTDPGETNKWKNGQRTWLAGRDKACSMTAPADCLKKSYATRFKQLSTAYAPL